MKALLTASTRTVKLMARNRSVNSSRVLRLWTHVVVYSYVCLTATAESRAATARMSAQETVRGHTASTWALMLSTTVKPLIDPTFGNAVCSPVKVAVSFSNTDASQPWR